MNLNEEYICVRRNNTNSALFVRKDLVDLPTENDLDLAKISEDQDKSGVKITIKKGSRTNKTEAEETSCERLIEKETVNFATKLAPLLFKTKHSNKKKTTKFSKVKSNHTFTEMPEENDEDEKLIFKDNKTVTLSAFADNEISTKVNGDRSGCSFQKNATKETASAKSQNKKDFYEKTKLFNLKDREEFTKKICDKIKQEVDQYFFGQSGNETNIANDESDIVELEPKVTALNMTKTLDKNEPYLDIFEDSVYDKQILSGDNEQIESLYKTKNDILIQSFDDSSTEQILTNGIKDSDHQPSRVCW